MSGIVGGDGGGGEVRRVEDEGSDGPRAYTCCLELPLLTNPSPHGPDPLPPPTHRPGLCIAKTSSSTLLSAAARARRTFTPVWYYNTCETVGI